MYKRVIDIRKKVTPVGNQELATAIENYAGLLRRMKRISDAEKIETRAKSLKAK
ncbi:MAG TPA: hypothetical protein VFC63_11305 [Blastocatellia bacterium]|nr:hypothetical protein [Blastocatellia bacterium]